MKSKACAVALVAMAGTLCAASVSAEESATPPTSKDATSAMRVVVDPETGEVRAPTPDEIRSQAARRNASSPAAAARSAARAAAPSSTHVVPEEKSVQRHSSGMLSVKLPRDSLSLLKATSSNGTLEIEHSNEAPAPVASEE